MRFTKIIALAAVLAALALPAQAEKVDVDKAMAERSLGKADAPITIYEYASMTCSHCAHFHQKVLPTVKEKLIETGKARLVFRDFPLDKFALKAAMMARCAPEDKYFPLLGVIFNNQERWTKAKDIEESLAQLGALTGMDKQFIAACMKNEELEKAIMAGLQKARELNIRETPSFRFEQGGEKLAEWPEFDEIFKNGMKH